MLITFRGPFTIYERIWAAPMLGVNYGLTQTAHVRHTKFLVVEKDQFMPGVDEFKQGRPNYFTSLLCEDGQLCYIKTELKLRFYVGNNIRVESL